MPSETMPVSKGPQGRDGLERVVEELANRLENQEHINDRAYTGLIARIIDLERKSKEKEPEPVRMLVRESSKDKLATKAVSDKLIERIAAAEEELRRSADKQSYQQRSLNSLTERIRELAEAREQQSRISARKQA